MVDFVQTDAAQYVPTDATQYVNADGSAAEVGKATPAPLSDGVRALARILMNTRNVRNEAEGVNIPMYFAPREATADLAGEAAPGTGGHLDPFNRLTGEHLAREFHHMGRGFGGGRDEDMIARNMTRFMRAAGDNNWGYGAELNRALLEMGGDPATLAASPETRGRRSFDKYSYATADGEASSLGQQYARGLANIYTRSGGSHYAPGQDQKAAPGTIKGAMDSAQNPASVFGVFGMANFVQGLINSMRYGSPFRNTAYSPYPELDAEGNAIPGTEIAVNTDTWGDDTSGPDDGGGGRQQGGGGQAY